MTLAASTEATRLNGTHLKPADALAAAPAETAAVDTDGLVRFLTPEGTLLPGRTAPMDDAEAVRLYSAMLRNRLVDERMIMIQRQGRIGFYIGSTGEEAAIIGTIAAMRPSDWLFPCYRENGGYLLRGMPFQRFVDNLFGNASDPVKGRQMPNHISWKDANIASVSSPIGTQLPQAVGAAFAAKSLGKDDVTMGFIGEGGTSSNDFHTALNFAGVWKSPVIFVVRNNQWAISVPREKQCAATHFADNAAGYGMPGIRVDGNDLFATYAVTRDAIARARRGEGPTMLECVTYRITGHSTSDDPKVYRKETEVEPWRAKDPLVRMKKYLVAKGAWSDEKDAELRARIDEECKAAITAAEHAPPPEKDTLFEEVFATVPWHLEEQRADMHANAGGKAAPEGAFPL